MMKPDNIIRCTLSVLMVLGAGGVFGQSYPSKVVRVISGEVGGATDIATRIVTERLSAGWGQPVVVENRTTPLIGGEVMINTPPDGYTVFFTASNFWTGPLFQKMPFDPIKDFVPITMVSTAPVVIAVLPALKVESIKDLIGLAKSKPGVLNFGTATNGTAGHLAAELLKSMTGTSMQRIEYKGAAQSLTGLLGGEVQIAFLTVPSAMPMVKAGTVKALAVTSAQPSATAPGVPTVASYGLPGYEVASSIGVFVMPKTPEAITNQLNRDIVRILLRTDVKERFLSAGSEAVGNSPEQFLAAMKAEVARLSKVVKDAGISPE